MQLGPIPSYIALAHHNGVAGRDIWKDVRQLIVVGRTLPTAAAVERDAEALTGIAVPPIAGGRYELADAVREMADGTGVAAEAERHPHPVCEAIRWDICEGQLVQIIGRARGINRDEANPVDVLVLTDVVLPMPVNEILSAKDLDPSNTDFMFAAGGVAFVNTTHATEAYSQFWPSPAAAKMAFHRAPIDPRWVTPHREEYIYSVGCYPPLTQIAYQVDAKGSRPAIAWCDLAITPDPRRFLEEKLARLGRLKSFEIVAPVPAVAPEVVDEVHLPPPERLPSVDQVPVPSRVVPVAVRPVWHPAGAGAWVDPATPMPGASGPAGAPMMWRPTSATGATGWSSG